MKVKDINIGDILNVVGDEIAVAGCDYPCKRCFSRIRVTDISKNNGKDTDRCIAGDGIDKTGNCEFRPIDLEPIKIKNWREFIND